jgi:hypothetical protein
MSNNPNNRLGREKSPYLLQHADNPVDWFPWGADAFEKARQEDKPIFLSIGYSTCHWCHVMERESFEDQEVADYLNAYFVSIKVDREERPDIDSIYMRACQMLTGGGGWPLTIVMTPDKQPFFAGTYFPKTQRGQRPGLLDILQWVMQVWTNDREDLVNSASKITSQLQKDAETFFGEDLTPKILHAAYLELKNRFDVENGGFGTAPKFPSPHNLLFLLRYSCFYEAPDADEMVLKTLAKMRSGGIFDHLGFGFHRYSTDAGWLLPHFEKMLYDQAMILMAYAEAYHKTKNKVFLSVIEEIFTYLTRDMQSLEGVFYSAEDADSEGIEGKFYLWEKAEIDALLGDNAPFFCAVYNIAADGNFTDPVTGKKDDENILHTKSNISTLTEEFKLDPAGIATKLRECRDILFAAREKRIRPLRDDKVVTDWNGLMIAALAYAGNVTNTPSYIQAAESAMQFILDRMLIDEQRLCHHYREGEAAIDGTLEDYAFVIWGLLELYEATFKNSYLLRAIGFTEHVIGHFCDTLTGGFYFTADYSEELITRQKEVYDGAIPSGNSVMLTNLIRLGRLTSKSTYLDEAGMIIRAFSDTVKQAPSAFSYFLNGVMLSLGQFHEVVVLADRENVNTKRSLRELTTLYQPNLTILLRGFVDDAQLLDTIAPHTKEMKPLQDSPTFFVCENFECKAPVTDIEHAIALIKGEEIPESFT